MCTEAEYRALAAATSELIWISSLLREIGFPLTSPPRLFRDNIGATYLTASPIFHTRSRHLEIEFHFVRDLVSQRKLEVCYISSEDQVADLFTKSLSKGKFLKHRDKLLVRSPPIRLKGSDKDNI